MYFLSMSCQFWITFHHHLQGFLGHPKHRGRHLGATTPGRRSTTPSVCLATGGLNESKIFQERYNTPRQSTPQTIPLDNYERNPFMACWQRLLGVCSKGVLKQPQRSATLGYETSLNHVCHGQKSLEHPPTPKKRKSSLNVSQISKFHYGENFFGILLLVYDIISHITGWDVIPYMYPKHSKGPF